MWTRNEVASIIDIRQAMESVIPASVATMPNIQNASEVPTEWALNVVRLSGWPDDKELLLFLGSMPFQRECGSAVWSEHRTQSVGREGLWSFGEWDFAITVTECTTNLFTTHPAFVAWIIAHEIGHALLTLREPVVQSIYLFVQGKIRNASNYQIEEWIELPHEQVCDRFGRYVAELVVGKKAFESQLRDLLQQPESPMGAARLEWILDSEPLRELPPMLPPLRELIRPYSQRLKELWVEDAARGAESYVAGIDPAVLFG